MLRGYFVDTITRKNNNNTKVFDINIILCYNQITQPRKAPRK